MREFQERKKLRKILYSKKILALLLIVLALLIYSTAKIYFKSRNALSKSEETRLELAELEQRKAELEKEILRLQTPLGEEEEIRRKFSVSRPEEKILVIVDKAPENDKINSSEETGFFGKIWSFVKSMF